MIGFKKTVLMALLAVLSNSAMAEWTKSSLSGEGDNTVYVDLATIRKNGYKVKMWEIWDTKTSNYQYNSIRYLSTKVQAEYDCKEEQLRTLALTMFSGNMGKGQVVYTSSHQSQWQPVQPESIGEIQFKVACGKIKQ